MWRLGGLSIQITDGLPSPNLFCLITLCHNSVRQDIPSHWIGDGNLFGSLKGAHPPIFCCSCPLLGGGSTFGLPNKPDGFPDLLPLIIICCILELRVCVFVCGGERESRGQSLLHGSNYTNKTSHRLLFQLQISCPTGNKIMCLQTSLPLLYSNYMYMYKYMYSCTHVLQLICIVQ